MVDKGSPDNLVSFCGQGVRKVGLTQFEARAASFIPTSNLSILILSPAQPEPSDVQNVGADRDGSTNVMALNCDQLWYQRNSVFKAAGYCFHTPRGISIFGNAGCAYDNVANVPLSDADRRAINTLEQVERIKSCLR